MLWMDAEKSRVRLKLPSGLEVEAEGQPEFVRAQVNDLLRYAEPPPAKIAGPQLPLEPEALEKILDQEGAELSLRALPPGAGDPQDACLALILGSEKRLGQPKPTAAQLAKWLRKSGFSILRMDRSLKRAVINGHILASGSRRSRRYELSQKGRIQALLAAERLARVIGKQ
jgi:hypothetical protein